MKDKITELKIFLSKANKNTYANKNAAKTKSSRLNSEDYHFESGDLIYHDAYFGGRNFIGEEIVYKNKKPFWGANYFGFVTNSEIDEKIIYDFLRQALMQDYESDIPVRGPKEWSDRKWAYQFNVDGNLGNFSGEELIFFKDKIVYRCLIHGGFIK